MAKFVATDYNITFGTADWSSSIAAVTLDITAETADTTAFGSTYRSFISGLKVASLTVDFHQDFAAGAVDATFFPLLGSAIAFQIKPTSGSVTATNPAYSGTAIVSQYTPFANSVGDLATQSLAWTVSGPVTRSTSV
jgi:hypothetical protein